MDGWVWELRLSEELACTIECDGELKMDLTGDIIVKRGFFVKGGSLAFEHPNGFGC